METATLIATQTPSTHAPHRIDRQAGPWEKFWLAGGRVRAGRTGGEALLVVLMRGRVAFTTGCYGEKRLDGAVLFVVPAGMDYCLAALSDEALLLCCRFDKSYLLGGERPMLRFARRAARALPVLHSLPLHERLYAYLDNSEVFMRVGQRHEGHSLRTRDEVFELMMRCYRLRRLAPVFHTVFDPVPDMRYKPAAPKHTITP